ncbi:helix-turn-helix domain-containing protein [Sporomusa acidovorans]|uniref:HTH cro/C1-type domain-containing protein n=1 Tax=Sporomusa acidovorans (strain ATCC 49682 / DSM 3132 / Mol) TaxID=1123286 RepID=A0ABZ3JAY4_SPOA4|nr:helix-turn-helix transcriptional regulator [Sporomusa acidovorans]OZC13235.1 HTH-type transcriptional regulator ImmR [Sporomusa acidovorans DSM 3132]SDE00275.1 Transcriptional regulator, contains XRE-family HTH domain [Sporomusa acidovorans]
MSLGKRLAALRDSKDLTQKQLAQLTKISRSRLSLYETDKREPDLQTLKQLAGFFNVSIDYLVIGYDSTSPILQFDTIPNDLLEFLKLKNVRFGNKILTEEDKAKIKASLDIIFWDTKQKTDEKYLK